MDKHDVFVNGRSVIHKCSGDKAIASAPGVCKTPIGSTVVPSPTPISASPPRLKMAVAAYGTIDGGTGSLNDTLGGATSSSWVIDGTSGNTVTGLGAGNTFTNIQNLNSELYRRRAG